MNIIPQLRSEIDAVRAGGRQRDTCCPAHDDRRESLSVGRGDDGRILLHCQAGCSTDAVLTSVGLTMGDLFPPQSRTESTTARRIAKAYAYEDEEHNLLFEVVRFKSPKDFRQRRPDGMGGWTWNTKGVRRVLYLLPDLRFRLSDQAAQAYRKEHNLPNDVFIVEGEKDVEALWCRGIVATTNPGGAGKWRDEYTQQLVAAGATSVVILPDNDDPGRQHAEAVALSCHAAGLLVKVVTLPGLPEKGDVSDWLKGKKDGLEQLLEIVKATPICGSTTEAAAAKPAVPPSKPKKEKAEKPKQGSEVIFEDVEPWRQSVNGAVLLDSIAQTFSRHLALPKHASTALALWVLHAWALDVFFISPILAISSPVKRCGKTLTLIVLGALVPRRMFAANVTPAVLFRTIEKYAPTLLIDEADTFIRDNDELRGVINSGLTRTTAVCIRAVGDDHDPRAFSTWCPKAIALIGKLPGTLADRAIEVPMRRRTAGEHVARLRQDRIGADCAELRQQAARWTDDHLQRLQHADPDVPDGLHDRAADCWRPLLAIADAAGGRWPALTREAAVVLSGESSDDDAGTMLLADIKTIFEDYGDPDALGSTAIVEKLVAIEDRPWAEWSKGRPLSTAKLARILGAYGIHPAGTLRVGTKTMKGYRRDAFVETWDRYPPSSAPQEGLKPSHRNNANESGPEVAISKRHNPNECDDLRSVTNPMNTGRCDAVTLLDPLRQEEDDDAHYGA